MKPQTIILIGRSGCGKGTQGKLLKEYLQSIDPEKRPLYAVETGAQFREFIKGEGYSNKISKEIYDNADRQPDFLAIWTWANLFVKNVTGEEHLVLDGMPRSLPEAMVLHNALKFYDRKANIVFLNVSRKTSEERLLARGRADDSTLAKITKRLDWYDNDVLPALEFFKSLGDHNFIEVNGDQDIEKVQEEIRAAFKVF